MGKEILVNVANRETRISVIEDNQLVEYRVEREDQVVGNIYKGRVENVLPGMDAAFVDIGLERNAFLFVDDILPEYVSVDSAAEEPGVDANGFHLTSDADELASEADDADIDLEAEMLAAVEQEAMDLQLEIEDAEEPVEPEPADPAVRAAQSQPPQRRTLRRPGRGRGGRRYQIQELVSQRQELMVQVVKGPRGTKGSRVSTRMSLPGRYLVLMPEANNLGISRKIDESKERDRLKRIVERFRQPGYGIIVRTEAESKHASDLYQDYLMLIETWQHALASGKTTPAPGLIYQDLSLIYTIIRDAFGSDVDKLIIDSAADYAKAHEIIDRISPTLADRIELYDGEKPMFEHFRIEDDVERLLRRKVWLRSGGYLIIDQTEALTSIDVNTGKFTGGVSGLSETILQTNMEATGEIGRQLRLRDLGGMIILDFIDMDNPRDKKSVTDALMRALKNDRSRTKISSISPLGLVEMTRKRTRETVDIALTDVCPYCHGLGRISSAETVSMQAEREIAKMSQAVNTEAILVICHPDVAAHLIGAQGEDIDRLERQIQKPIYIRADPQRHIEKVDIEPGSAARIEAAHLLPKRGQVVDLVAERSLSCALPWAMGRIPTGYQVDITNAGKLIGQNVKVRLNTVGRSVAVGEVANPTANRQTAPRQQGPRPDQRQPNQPRAQRTGSASN